MNEYYVFFGLILIIAAIIIVHGYYFGSEQIIDGFINTTDMFDKNIKTFMIRDIRTNLWLNVDGKGLARFGASGFGFNFRLSNDPEEFLPLRSANNPNDYIISSSDGKDDFRIVSNPGSDLMKIQVMNLQGKNILGYQNNDGKDVYISINQAGYISTVESPGDASFVSMIFV